LGAPVWSYGPILLALVATPAPAGTESSSGALTLAEALRLAAVNNEVPAIARARVDRAKAARQEAYYNCCRS
jgi:hypothetical protein